MKPTARSPRPGGAADGADAMLREVLAGLARPDKKLPCKYFYDERGSRLFDEICELEEYYLTRCELAILRRDAGEMAGRLGPGCALVEYGSGSSLKTRLLLDRLDRPAAYVPVDISGEHLLRSARRLARAYPDLEVVPVCADFTRPFPLPPLRHPPRRRVVYFSGSTIGNFGPAEATALLAGIARLCGPGGGLLIGVDLKKDRAILEAAYNDRRRVTAAFNLNLLARLNRELGADFDLGGYRHHAFYNAGPGRIEMHLVSLVAQTVHVGGAAFELAAGETICTEYSYKYGLDDFRALAARVGLAVEQVWTDERGLFSVQYLRC
jgi:dimethylhistidine N-methyltransferase